MINEFVSTLPIPREKIVSACVVFTGRINSEKGYNNTFFYFEDAPLDKLIESKINIKTFIENDSRAMLYGEYCSGDAGRKKNVIYLNISWGFGISIIVMVNFTMVSPDIPESSDIVPFSTMK